MQGRQSFFSFSEVNYNEYRMGIRQIAAVLCSGASVISGRSCRARQFNIVVK